MADAVTGRQRLVRTADGQLVTLAVVWSPEDAAALARDLAEVTGRPINTLPDHFQEGPR